MKLCEVPRNTWIIWEGERIKFVNLDGMYSYCLTEEREVVHLAAWSEVELDDSSSN